MRLAVKGLFKPAYQAEKQGRWLFIDARGGFGVYPTVKHETARPDTGRNPWAVEYPLRKGEELWISIFPPRPYNRDRADNQLMAHEGNEAPYVYPSTALIQSTARYCKVMVVHSWFWPGGDGRPGRSPRSFPRTANSSIACVTTCNRAGMKNGALFQSLFTTRGTTSLPKCAGLLDDYRVDGLYFDGVDDGLSHVVRHRPQNARDARQRSDPLPALHQRSAGQAPASTAHSSTPISDYIYRGEAGRAGLELDAFLRWTLSGYNISNAVGYWVYTGSTGKPGYVRDAPTREHIDAALRNEVRLPRTEIGYEHHLAWKPGDGHLAFFDNYYYGALKRARDAQKP